MLLCLTGVGFVVAVVEMPFVVLETPDESFFAAFLAGVTALSWFRKHYVVFSVYHMCQKPSPVVSGMSNFLSPRDGLGVDEEERLFLFDGANFMLIDPDVDISKSVVNKGAGISELIRDPLPCGPDIFGIKKSGPKRDIADNRARCAFFFSLFRPQWFMANSRFRLGSR
jgi:hypothetical protein